MGFDELNELIARIDDHHTEEEWRRLFTQWDDHVWHDAEPLDEKTNVLMIDAHAVLTDGVQDLDALHELLKDHVEASVSDLYLVSLFPHQTTSSETALDPRIRFHEDLGRFKQEFGLMFELTPDVYNERQFNLLSETDRLIALLAQGATSVRVHVQSFRGMPEERIRHVFAVWHAVVRHYKPKAQLVLAYDAVNGQKPSYFDVADVICHFDLSSHVILAFAQDDATRLGAWVGQIEPPPYGKTYFTFLSTPERDPFEKNLLEPSVAMILAAHSVLLSIQGMPAIDYRTLLGITQPIERDTLVHDLKTDPYRLQVFSGILSQLNVKRTQPALSPYAEAKVIKTDKRVFAVERTNGGETLTVYTNVSAEAVPVDSVGTNVFTGEPVDGITLGPYDFIWVKS